MFNRWILSFLLLFVAFHASATSLEARSSSDYKHHIFFVHGIGSGPTAFGVMPAALRMHLKQSQPNVEFKSYVFAYPTENDQMTTDDFAILFGNFISNQVGELQPQDKISVVAHSQGGLVSTIWYFHSSLGKPEFHPELSSHLENLVTLGTPFWGSKVASIAIDQDLNNPIIKYMGRAMIEKLGRRQLEEMSMDSTTILRFRKNVVTLGDDAIAQMASRIRPLNISGVFDGYRKTKMPKILGFQPKNPVAYLNPLVFGDKYYESDGAVLLPSARFDSHYAIEEKTEDGKPGRFKHWQTSFGKHMTVMGIHASPNAEEYYDLSELPTKCFILSQCNHPTYPWILKHFLGQEVPSHAPDTRPLEYTGFIVSVKMILPEGQDANLLKEKIKIDYMNNVEYSDFDVVFAPEKELVNRHEFVHPKRKNEIIVTITGHLKVKNVNGVRLKKVHDKGMAIVLNVQAPGFRERLLPVKIQPTWTSFIEFRLLK